MFREAHQFGLAAAGGLERVAMKAQFVQQGYPDGLLECLQHRQGLAIMAQVSKSIPDLVGYIVRFDDELPAEATNEMHSEERRRIECKGGVQHGDGMGPHLFCLILVPIVLCSSRSMNP